MKVIIAGSRTITDPLELEKAIKDSGFTITEVISGGATGPDSLGAAWANENNIPVGFYYPDWKQFGKKAGPIRNSLMAADAGSDGGLIALWDGSSKGTKDIITKCEGKGMKVYIHIIKNKEDNDG